MRLKVGIIIVPLAFCASTLLAQEHNRGARPGPPAPPPAKIQPGDPLRGLTAAQLERFNDGKEDFNEVETIEEGLGPSFNGRSCAECHKAPAVGAGSERTVTRFGKTTNGVFDPLAGLGGSLLQDHAIGIADGATRNFKLEEVPRVANVVAHRRSTSLLGLGLVEATPDFEFEFLARAQALSGGPVAGKVSHVTNISTGNTQAVGKFGWKGQNPTLFQFAGDAYVNELGITNPQFMSENCPNGDCSEMVFNPDPGINDDGEGVEKLGDFMLMLAPPQRGEITSAVTDGERIFNRIGCADCHVSTLITGRNEIAALDRQIYHPYSDFLLHDMGSLGDGVVQGGTSGRQMRTAPLWGVRFSTTLLHDGRATTLQQAIEAHDGEARTARDRFRRLLATERDRLMAFLRSL